MGEVETLAEKNRRLEDEVRDLKQREAVSRKLALAVEYSPVAVMITDQGGTIEYVNPRFCSGTGYSREEAVGSNPRILKSGTHSAEFYRELWETILSGREWRGEFHNRNKDGSLVWELASISPVVSDSGTITHFVGVKEDITELKRLQQELKDMAHLDELTGLPNRALFLDRVEQVAIHARRNLGRFALLFVDLDGFKEVNDRYGHLVGDEVLREVAQRLIKCVRSSDTVARLGGDEFIMILNDLTHWEEPGIVAKKVLESMSRPCSSQETRCTVGVSIGIAIFPDDAPEVEKLIACADAAMYEVKERGKNSYQYWSKMRKNPGRREPGP